METGQRGKEMQGDVVRHSVVWRGNSSSRQGMGSPALMCDG